MGKTIPTARLRLAPNLPQTYHGPMIARSNVPQGRLSLTTVTPGVAVMAGTRTR